MVDVSIVLITWKMKKYLEVLLPSIKKYSKDFTYEIILVDNFSEDGTIEYISRSHPEIKIIKNIINAGVAPARNQGLKIASGRYLLVLDADMELKENSIKKMLDYMESNSHVGLLGCKLLDSANTLQHSCKHFPTLVSLFARRLEGFDFVRNSKILRYHTMADWTHDNIIEVDYVIGACQLFRRKVLEKIGLYDNRIFYGPEDLDFCLRVWRGGWSVAYFPHTTIIHFEQRITKKALFSKITFKHLQGIFYIFRKYKGKLSR